MAIGITALLRQLILLFVPFLLLWLWWRLATMHKASRHKINARHLLLRIAATGIIVAAFIAPWTLRNYRVFGTLVPLNTNAGYVLFWGNHPIYGTSFVGILPDDGPTYRELIPPELLDLNEAELDRALLQRGLGFIVEDPLRYLLLSLSRTREYFKFWPEATSSPLSNVARVGSFGLAWPLMVVGLWRTARHRQRREQIALPSMVQLFYLFLIIYTGVHLATWALIRYRLPVDSILLFFAAYSLAEISGTQFSALSDRH
jgi:hypothetical protein